MAKWREARFGDLPAGAVFRANEDDAGLYLKLAEDERSYCQDYNSVVIVSSRPGHRGWCQAGTFTEWGRNDKVQYLVGV